MARAAQPDDGGAVGGPGFVRLDERVARELVAHCLPHHAGPPPVDDAHLVVAGERRVVDELAHGLPGLLRRPPAEVELDRHVRGCDGRDPDCGWSGLCVSCSVPVREQPLDGNPHTKPSDPDHGRLVTAELFDEDWTGGEAINAMTLKSVGAQTLMTLTVTYSSREARDGAIKTGMLGGMEAGYARLDDVLEPA